MQSPLHFWFHKPPQPLSAPEQFDLVHVELPKTQSHVNVQSIQQPQDGKSLPYPPPPEYGIPSLL